MQRECPQVGSTILVSGSIQIPHSSSLSKSLSNIFLFSSTLIRRRLSELRADLLLVSSKSIIRLPSSCLSVGYITAAGKYFLTNIPCSVSDLDSKGGNNKDGPSFDSTVEFPQSGPLFLGRYCWHSISICLIKG